MARSLYLWKQDDDAQRVSTVRYAHGSELSKMPGVTGIGMGKDHIIVYVSSGAVKVPSQIEGVRLVKVVRAHGAKRALAH